MKKRIVAFLLVVVMAVTALVGCGASVYNYAEEDLTSFASFDADKFAELLAGIEIEDFDFTTDETVRAQKVLEKIYSTMTDKVVAVGDKVMTGAIGERDVLYYTYYATCEKDGVTHVMFYEAMEEARLNNSSYKTSHVIELGKNSSSSDELANTFRENLAAAISGKTVNAAYSTFSEKGAAIAAGDKVVISYKLDKVDSAGNKLSSDTVNYKEVTLGGTDPLLSAIVKAEYKNSVGNAATFADGAKAFVTTDGNGNTLTYSNVVVKWKITSPGEELASFSMVRFTSSSNATDVNNVQIDLKDVELTYHIYPVYIVNVPEYSATTLLKYILGSSIKTTSLEIFEDENYKVGEVKLSALIEELTKIYAGTTEDAKYAAVKTAKEAYDAAKAVVDEAGKNATEAQQEALDNATEALNAAKKTAVDAAIAEILTATSTVTGAKNIAEAITDEYDENVRHSLEEEYNTSVIKAVAKKIYDAIDKSVEVTAYPEEALKEAYNRLYEAYEYTFYNGDHSTNESEYSFHKGDFAEFLASHTKAKEVDGDIWKGIEAAITDEAKENLAPIIKIYVVAKALEADAKTDLLAWAELDKTAGRFDVEVDRDDYETEEAYNEAVTAAEESKTKSYENAKKEANRFLVTNEVFDQYRDEIGKAAFESFIADYGEVNLRTALQFEKIMNYLTSTSIERVDGHNHPAYTERDGKLYIDFRYDGLTYVTVEDADAGDGEGE